MSDTGNRATPIRIVVADNSRMASQMLVDALQRGGMFQAIGTPLDETEFVAAATALTAEIGVVGIGSNGSEKKSLELVRRVRTRLPDLKTIALFDTVGKDVLVEAFRAGVDGVVCRDDSIETLRKCVTCVHAGQIWANSAQLKTVLQVLSQQSVPRNVVDAQGTALLSKRELEVIRGVAEGKTNREIAVHLGLSEHTIKNYLFHVFEKLGVSNRTELLGFVLSHTSYIDKVADEADKKEASAEL